MSKSSFSSKVKITLLKGMEAIGTSASNLASNAKLKVNEINLQTRRREILTDFSLQAFEMWQKGVQLPEPLSEMLKELSDIEDRLSVLRAQKYAKVAGEPATEGKAPEAEQGEPAVPVDCSVADTETAEEEPVACTLGDVEASPETPVDEAVDPTAEVETEAATEGEPDARNE